MTTIDFYLIPDAAPQKRLLFICRLVEKIYHLHKNHIYVHAQDGITAHRIHDLLWTFRDISFIPHALANQPFTSAPSVLIGFHEPSSTKDILINLSDTVPNFYDQFNRVIEIVPNDDTFKSILRQHYKQYQNDGFSINIHDLKGTS